MQLKGYESYNHCNQVRRLSQILILFFFTSNVTNAQYIGDSVLASTKLRQVLSFKFVETPRTVDSLHQVTKNLSRNFPDSVIQIAKKIKAISINIDYKKGIAKSDEALARALIFKGFYSEGFEIARKTLDYAIEIKADSVYLDLINIFGLGHFLKGEYHKVYEFNQQGLQHAKKVENKDRIFVFSLNAATLMGNIGEQDKALFYYNSCLSMLQVHPDSVRLAQVLNNMGNVYFRKGDFYKAKEVLSESIKISKIKEMTSWESDGHITLGKTAIEENNFDEAEKHFRRSETLLKNSNDFKQLIETDLGFAKLDFINNNIEDSDNRAIKTLKKARIAKYYIGINEASKLLYDISVKQNKHKEAHTYLLMHTRLNDSLNIAQNMNKVRTMLVEKDLKNEQELTELKLNQKLAKQKIYIGVSIGLILILAVITFFIKSVSKIQKILIKQLNEKTIEHEKSKNELLDLHETKNKIFSIIGHDVKGPVASFQGLLQLLVSGDVKPDQFMSFLPKVNKDVNYIYFTLNNLLLWANTQMSGKSTNPEKVDLNVLVSSNINLVQTNARSKLITFKNELNPNIFAWTDRNEIDIVFRNLISNALKFTPRNGVISLNVEEKNDFWQVSVRDTGIGIDKATQDIIFSKNSNISTFGTENEKGTGLGLSLCKEMVENNKGTIWLESTPEKGTCFYFTIPKMKASRKK